MSYDKAFSLFVRAAASLVVPAKAAYRQFIAQLVITGQSAFRGLFALKMGIGDFAQIEICNEDYFLFADDPPRTLFFASYSPVSES
jgi:hypothetical protein